MGRIDDAYQPTISLAVPGRPGFYRFDIQIAGADGTELGSYSEYLRVVSPSIKVRLGLSSARVRPGQTVSARPEELGTEWLNYGEDFVVQRRSAGAWHHEWDVWCKRL